MLASCRRTGSDSADRTTPPPSTPSAAAAPVTTAPATSIASPVTTLVESSTPPSTIEPWSGAEFGELDDFLAGTGTEAFRIVEADAVVHEWYRSDAGYARDIASAQKSVLSLLVGRAVADGLFTLDTTIDSVLGTAWAAAGDTGAVTVRHLLSMTSGLDDQFAMIAAPGESWNYSGAFAALFDVVTTTTGRTLGDVAGEWLFDPAGATTARFYLRQSAAYAPIGLRATATDLTAIGQTVLDGTQPGLGADWPADSFASSQPFNPAYGLLWWLNGRDSYLLPGRPLSRPGPLIPSVPGDLVAALGKDDQKLYISRDWQLCVSRLGAKADPASLAALSSFDEQLWSMLVALRSR